MKILKSRCYKVGEFTPPKFDGRKPRSLLYLDRSFGGPTTFNECIKAMTAHLENKTGDAWLMIDGRFVKKGEIHRFPNPHVNGGRGLKPKESMQPDSGGIILLSNYQACRGWVGDFEGEPDDKFECSHMDLGEGFLLEPNSIYYANQEFVHESLPFTEDAHRTLIRITLPSSILYKEN